MDGNHITPDKTLDQQGLLCPMPIINTSKAISEIHSREVLEVLCTDPGSKPDFEAWARSTGHDLLSSSEEEGSPKVFRFLIRKR